MNYEQKQLLIDYWNDKVSAVEFSAAFGSELFDPAFIKGELHLAIESKDEDLIDQVMLILWLQENLSEYIDELHALLLSPNHRCHQEVVKEIQRIAHPQSVPIIDTVLRSDFTQFDYTCSETSTIAKWFSWALASIGSKEAIEVLTRFAESGRPGVKEEMQYRLQKIQAA